MDGRATAVRTLLTAVLALTVGGCAADGGREASTSVPASSASTSPTVEAVTPVELPADYPVSQVPLADGTVFYGFRSARGWQVQVQVADPGAQQAALTALTDTGFRITEQCDPDAYGSAGFELTDDAYVVSLTTGTPAGGPYGYTVHYTVGVVE